MYIKTFELERYFAKHEFSAPYLLSCSDCEPLSLNELLEWADDETSHLWDKLKLGYTESQGHPILRKEISNIYTNIDEDEVVVCTPQEGIFLTMNCLLENGDHIITTYPGYQSLYEIANSIGCKIDKWIPHPSESWHFEIDDLKKLVRNKTKALIINFPHNPTGATLSKEKFNELIRFANEYGLFIFSDEMYRYLEYDENNCLPSVSDIYDNSVSLFGLSKSFALAGLRMGWLTSKNKQLLQKIITLKDYTTICHNAPSEVLGIIALQNKNRILHRNHQILQKNLKHLSSFFDHHKSIFKWITPMASPVAFIELLDKQPVHEFARELVDKEGIMILPSDVFNFEGNYIRIGFGRENIPSILTLLDNYLND